MKPGETCNRWLVARLASVRMASCSAGKCWVSSRARLWFHFLSNGKRDRRIGRRTRLGSAPRSRCALKTPQPDELHRILHAAAMQADVRKSSLPRIVLVVQTPKGEIEMS